MLAPHYQELLTAYVDGELTARQRRFVARLLRRSGDARALLRRLQDDSREIQALPPQAIPVDVSVSVLEAISRRKLRPVRRTRQPVAAACFPAWTGLAAAAAVLLLVGLGSFLLYSRDPGPSGASNVSRQGNPDENGSASLPGEKDLAKTLPEKQTPKEQPAFPGPSEEEPGMGEFVGPVDEGKEIPIPNSKSIRELPDEPVLASGQKEASGKFERVEVALPSFFRLHELDQPGPAGKLRARFETGNALRIELPARDATRAFDRIQKAFASRKVRLVIDASAKARLKSPQFRSDYALFFENVTAKELVELLGAIGEADRTPAAGKKSPELRFDGSVVVKEMSGWDRHQLAELLGVDPVRVRPTIVPRVPAIDIHRPLVEGTMADVAAALEGKGVPRPQAGPGTRGALVVGMTGPRLRTAEMKRFLDGRQPAKANTVQVFLVLRSIGS